MIETNWPTNADSKCNPDKGQPSIHISASTIIEVENSSRNN